jgi:hypothetical protein
VDAASGSFDLARGFLGDFSGFSAFLCSFLASFLLGDAASGFEEKREFGCITGFLDAGPASGLDCDSVD